MTQAIIFLYRIACEQQRRQWLTAASVMEMDRAFELQVQVATVLASAVADLRNTEPVARQWDPSRHLPTPK